jgi:hypothetical protein
MKPCNTVFDTTMGICELRHGAYAKRHPFEFWRWALAAILAALTVTAGDSVPTPEPDAGLQTFKI